MDDYDWKKDMKHVFKLQTTYGTVDEQQNLQQYG